IISVTLPRYMSNASTIGISMLAEITLLARWIGAESVLAIKYSTEIGLPIPPKLKETKKEKPKETPK
ncbi:MAG TPA: hypothetical protein QF359_09605, partial [Rhodospirillales bacterium]|nr:hypothetical protein [Rhodospirillales bacterium]